MPLAAIKSKYGKISSPSLWPHPWLLTFTFDLLTSILIGISYSLRTINLPNLKFLGQSELHELLVAQGYRTRYRKSIDMTFDLWSTELNINRDHLIKVYLPLKFEVYGAKHSWIINCTKLQETDIPTNFKPTCANQYANNPTTLDGLNLHFCLYAGWNYRQISDS